MGVVPCFNVKVAAVMVAGSMFSLKVALTLWLTPTSVAALSGSVEVTVGTVGTMGATGLANSTNCCPHPASMKTRTRAVRLRVLIGGFLPSR